MGARAVRENTVCACVPFISAFRYDAYGFWKGRDAAGCQSIVVFLEKHTEMEKCRRRKKKKKKKKNIIVPRADTSSQIPADWTENISRVKRAGAEQDLTKDDIGLWVLGDDAQGDSIIWLSHSIRQHSKHFHVWITIYPSEIIDICLR